MTTIEEIVAGSIAGRRLNALLISLFAIVAAVLASIGIYGVISYSVVQRTHEIGVRVALGARRMDVLKLVCGHGIGLAALGIATGVGGALVLTRYLSSLIFGVTATDPTTFVTVPLLLFVVAAIACYLPARRATRVDPVVALRAD